MKNLLMATMALPLVMLVGCATPYAVTFDSNPQGAMVTCWGENMGYTPVTGYYDKGKLKNSKIKFFGSKECSANWASGAKTAYDDEGKTDAEVVQRFPNGVRVTVDRPNKAPGLKDDMLFALQVKQLKQPEAQTMAQQQAAAAAGLAAFNLGNINNTLMAPNTANQVNQNNMNLRNYNRGW
jgi:hypothetical protein